jgi:hypothetical protein
MNFLHLTRIEMRRALHRRLVRWMIFVALVGCAFAGVVAFIASSDAIELARSHQGHPAIMREWWTAGSDDGFLTAGAAYLAIGAAICGASVAGAEWKAGTITTVLTWVPSRVRLHGARSLSAALLAFAIGVALQVVLLASLLPAVFLHGNTDGIDGSWWWSLALAVLRIGFVTSLVATLALQVATIGRNTTAALVALSVWALALEGLVRGLRPGFARFLVSENVITVVPWTSMEGAEFERGPVLAALTLAFYVGLVVFAATAIFTRRDIASTA